MYLGGGGTECGDVAEIGNSALASVSPSLRSYQWDGTLKASVKVHSEEGD